MQIYDAYFSFNLSTNYARLDATAMNNVNNGRSLWERLKSFNAIISGIRKGMTPFKH